MSLNKYLTRESDKVLLKRKVENKQITLEESVHYCKELELTEEEIMEIFQGLANKVKRGVQYMSGDKVGARNAKADEVRDAQTAQSLKGTSLGQKVGGLASSLKGKAQTANANRKAAGIQKQIDQLEINKKRAQANNDSRAIAAIDEKLAPLQAQIDQLDIDKTGYESRSGTEIAQQKLSDKVSASGVAAENQVAKTLSKNVVTRVDELVGAFSNAAATAPDSGAVSGLLAKFQQDLAGAIKKYDAEVQASGTTRGSV